LSNTQTEFYTGTLPLAALVLSGAKIITAVASFTA